MEKASPINIFPKKYSIGSKANPVNFSNGINLIFFLLKHVLIVIKNIELWLHGLKLLNPPNLPIIFIPSVHQRHNLPELDRLLLKDDPLTSKPRDFRVDNPAPLHQEPGLQLGHRPCSPGLPQRDHRRQRLDARYLQLYLQIPQHHWWILV